MNILVIGGNRFFGRKLVERLLDKSHSVTVLNRGSLDDGFGDRVQRIQCDRTDKSALISAVAGQIWDVVYDQVCYDYKDAKEACEVFAEKAGRYIVTSTQSVYEAGESIKESEFDPTTHKIEKYETKDSHYPEAKRQAEVAFHEFARFPVTAMRIPIVIGNDDYTERFSFHVNRIKEGREIYFPNLEARISFVTSDFASEALAAFCEKSIDGPINVASPSPISLGRLVKIVEEAVGKSAKLASQPTDETHSPYGIEKDWFMDCSKLREYGLVASEIEEWLPALLR